MTTTTKRPIPPLRELRESRGLTTDQLAVLAGTNKGTISKIERGLLPMSPDLIVRLSRALKVTTERITG